VMPVGGRVAIGGSGLIFEVPAVDCRRHF